MAATSYTLQVSIPDDATLTLLNEAKLRINLYLKVNDTYSVVWVYDHPMSNTNTITWQTQYKIFTVQSFQDGSAITIQPHAQLISSGQTATLNKDNVLSLAVGASDASGTFHLQNDFGFVCPAVATVINGKESTIFVDPTPEPKGVIDLTPTPKVYVAFSKLYRTPTMIQKVVTNGREVEYGSDTGAVATATYTTDQTWDLSFGPLASGAARA